MVLLPNCKINLGLNIVVKRVDGYHNLETVFYPIQIKDAIEVIEEKKSQHSVSDVQFSISGLEIDGDIENNLCVKAYKILKEDFPQLPPLKIHLHKTIPMGAGLGGGSADGAFTLKLINKKYDLNISDEQLIKYALQLGSDCPFFILNTPCFATGRGERLEPVTLELSNYKIVLVHPGVHISTIWAFEQLSGRLQRPDSYKRIKEIIKLPIVTWKQELKNDFEDPVFKKYPEIKKIKDDLYNAGAVYASMSGSGSSVYGIFEKENQINVSFPSNYFVKFLNS